MPYGFICSDEDYEWWIRREDRKSSNVIISRESPYRISEYNLDYVTSRYCQCPDKVKQAAKEIISKLKEN